MEFHRYAPVPRELGEELVAKYKAEREAEKK